MWPAISSGEWRSSAITRDAELELAAPPRRRPRASRARARRGGRWTTSRRSRARRSAPRAAPATSGSSPAATPNPRCPLLTAGSLLQQRDALDVRRLREHVDRLHAAQPISRLDHLGGVRRQRRRVAGDVDDPRRLALEQPADDLRREPGARRVDDDDVGPAGLLDQRPDPEPRVGRDEAGVRDPVARGVVLGVGDRLGDALEPPDLAGAARRARGRSCRSRSRGRRRARCRSSPAKSPAIA